MQRSQNGQTKLYRGGQTYCLEHKRSKPNCISSKFMTSLQEFHQTAAGKLYSGFVL